MPPTQLILLLILCHLPPSLSRLTSHDTHLVNRLLRRRRQACVENPPLTICNGRSSPAPGLDPENCINECISTACFSQIYATQPVSLFQL